MQSTCPGCGRYYTHQLDDTWLIICQHCRHQITNRDIRDEKEFDMPDDLSTLQIGTTGIYKAQSFVITGRIRFQLKTDFRNLWCARYGDKTIWIGQSLESVGFFTPPFMEHTYQFDSLRAGVFVEFTDDIKLKCEMMEPCIDVRYEGEISRFPYPNAKITLIQASNTKGNTALIFKNRSGQLHYLWGELMLVYGYKFDNLKKWAEW
jgi:hypothetical protein